MTTLAFALVLGGVAALVGLRAGRGANPRLDHDGSRTFDEHTATALVLLTPDALDNGPTPFADDVDAWLRAGAPSEDGR